MGNYAIGIIKQNEYAKKRSVEYLFSFKKRKVNHCLVILKSFIVL